MHTRAAAGAREMLAGYTQYHIDNRGALLFGYTPPTVNGTPVTAFDPRTGATYGLPVADRYPWRLAAYVGHVWDILHLHEETPAVPQPGDPHAPPMTPDTAEYKAYLLSLEPAFGINSVYVGGHAGTVYQGFAGPAGDRPNVGKHVVFRQSEVREPSNLIVFAEEQQAFGGAPVPVGGAGFHYLTPPRANGVHWTVTHGKFQLVSPSLMGLPKGRFGPRTVVGFFDGHVASLMPEELTDMRLWANRATSPDYDFVH
jgi:prepilin-type processing-associated H-X9-DG protein